MIRETGERRHDTYKNRASHCIDCLAFGMLNLDDDLTVRRLLGVVGLELSQCCLVGLIAEFTNLGHPLVRTLVLGGLESDFVALHRLDTISGAPSRMALHLLLGARWRKSRPNEKLLFSFLPGALTESVTGGL